MAACAASCEVVIPAMVGAADELLAVADGSDGSKKPWECCRDL
jgi:hypothetical protein